MTAFVLVNSDNGLENIVLVQHYSRTDFKEDWKFAQKVSRDVNRGRFIEGIYRVLRDMGWSITSLHCTEVSY